MSGPLLADQAIPIELQEVGIEEHLGDSISLDLEFTNDKGETVLLKDYFDGKRPVILNLVYYECPNLCTLLLNGFTKSLKDFEWTPGENYEIISISIDHEEDKWLAQKKKEAYIEKYGRPEAADHWHFLLGSQENIKQIADELGFKFRYDERQDEYAHSSVLFILTPDGKISRYLYGIEFPTRDLRLSLLEAAEGKIGSIVDKLLLFCYHYDPIGKQYAILAVNMMKVAAAVTVIVLSILIVLLFKKYNKKEDPQS